MRFAFRLTKLVSKQARREGGELTALWVRARARDYGELVHILMHLPADPLRGRTGRWIEAALAHARGEFRDRYARTRPRARESGWIKGISLVRIVAGRLNKVGGNRQQAHR